MKLGDILSSSGRAQPVKPHPVKFIAIGLGPSFERVTAKVNAVMVCLDEDQRSQARVKALEEIERRFKDKVVPKGILEDEETYHMLFAALKEPETVDGKYESFCVTPLELRSALVLPEARRLWAEYNAYMAREFPEVIDDEAWKQLLEDAKKNSLTELLISTGYARVSQVLTFLASHSSP